MYQPLHVYCHPFCTHAHSSSHPIPPYQLVNTAPFFFFYFHVLVCETRNYLHDCGICTYVPCLSHNSLISQCISAKFRSVLFLCMLYKTNYFHLDVNT